MNCLLLVSPLFCFRKLSMIVLNSITHLNCLASIHFDFCEKKKIKEGKKKNQNAIAVNCFLIRLFIWKLWILTFFRSHTIFVYILLVLHSSIELSTKLHPTRLSFNFSMIALFGNLLYFSNCLTIEWLLFCIVYEMTIEIGSFVKWTWIKT